MKKLIQLLLPVLFLLAGLQGTAQSKAQKQVEEKVEQLKKAMIDGDSVMLDKLASADLIYRHSSGLIDDKAAFVHKLASGQSDFVSIGLSEKKIAMPNKKTSIVCHNLDAKTNDGGKPGDVHLYVMLVWQKQHGSWKMVARQAAKKV